MAIDTQVPAWLQRNWAPREPFDPTPWLQERYRRQERQQEISLRVQEFGLRAQALQLGIQQQAMANEQASLELAFQKEDLPAYSEYFKAGDFSKPPPTLRSKKFQESILSAQKVYAESEYGKTRLEHDAALTKAATYLLQRGVEVQPEEDGRFTAAAIAAAGKVLDDREQRELESIWKLRISSGGAGGPEVSEKRALALQRARDAVAAAKESGDPELVARGQQFLADLEVSQKRNEPTFAAKEVIRATRAELSELDREITRIEAMPGGASNMYALDRLKARKEELEARLRNPPAEPAVPAPATNPTPGPETIGRFKVIVR